MKQVLFTFVLCTLGINAIPPYGAPSTYSSPDVFMPEKRKNNVNQLHKLRQKLKAAQSHLRKMKKNNNAKAIQDAIQKRNQAKEDIARFKRNQVAAKTNSINNKLKRKSA